MGGSLRAPCSQQYLNLFLHVLIQAVDFGLKVLGKLSTLCFQCWRQKPVFNGKGLWVKMDAFDLEEKNVHTHAHLLVIGNFLQSPLSAM